MELIPVQVITKASAIGKQGGGPGAVVDRDCSAEVDMSIQALVEGALSGALKGVKTGDGLKGAKPRTTGEMDVGRIIAQVIAAIAPLLV